MKDDLLNNQNNDSFEDHYNSISEEDLRENQEKTEDTVYGQSSKYKENFEDTVYGESTEYKENFEDAEYGESAGYGEDSEGAESEEDNNVCRKCGSRYIDTSESQYSILCTECREQQIRYPISKVFALFGVLIVCLIAVAFKQLPGDLKDYKLYLDSKTVEDGNVSKSLDGLKEVADKHEDFMDARVDMIDIAMKSGRYQEGREIINKYLYDKKVDMDIYNRVNSYIDKIEHYDNTYDLISQLFDKSYEYDTYEESLSYLKSSLEELLGGYNTEDAMVYYYLAFISSDYKEAEDYLKKSIESDGSYIDSKIYLGTVKIYQNKLDESREIFNEILSNDNEIAAAYQGLAIINLLENDAKKALDNSMKAYELNKYYSYSINTTLMISLYENGMTEDLEKVKTETVSYEDLDEALISVLEGKMTAKEYYIVDTEEK